MFGKKNAPPNPANIDCLISAKTRIDGDLQYEGGLRVDGKIIGNLTGDDNSMLVVSEQATLEGEVRAAHAIINGSVKGTVHCLERLELQSKARIIGDVHYRTLEMHPGAVVEGRLVHRNEQDDKAASSEGTVTPIQQNRATA